MTDPWQLLSAQFRVTQQVVVMVVLEKVDAVASFDGLKLVLMRLSPRKLRGNVANR